MAASKGVAGTKGHSPKGKAEHGGHHRGKQPKAKALGSKRDHMKTKVTKKTRKKGFPEK